MPRRRSRRVSASPAKQRAGCAFWVRRSSSSDAVVRRPRRSMLAADAHWSHSAETSSSWRSSTPMPGCCEPWPGKRKAMRGAMSPSGLSGHLPMDGEDTFWLFLGFDDFAAGARAVVAAVRTDRVRSPHVLAVRGGLDLDQRQLELRAAAALLRLGQVDLRE